MHLKLVSRRGGGESSGSHIRIRVFMGEDKDHLALCGNLTFRVGEWQLFAAALRLGSQWTQGHLSLIVEDRR